MAWVKEIDDSKFLVVDDWGPKNSDYAGCYAKATLAIETDGDKVKYTVKMYTEVDGGHSKKPGVFLYLSIDGQVIFNDYWVYSKTSSSWNGFPTLNGSSRSGTITTKEANDASIPVVLKIATSQWQAAEQKVVSKDITRTWYTKGTAPTVIVTDKKNNTVTVSGALGKNGENNKIESAAIYYTTDNSDPSSSSSRSKIALTATSGGSYSKSISITKKCTFKAYVECKFEHNTTSASAASSSSVIYYVAPTKPGVPVISYKKSRLTIKEPWTFTWTAATARNTDSPVRGYRIRIYKTGTLIKGLVDGTGNTIGMDKSKQNEYLDLETTSCTITFDPVALGFLPGDKVLLGIYSYSKDGAGNKLWNDGGGADAIVTSANYLVYNAGIVHTKVNGIWEEGQVFVKVNGAWQEAETVNVKVNGTWHESE